MGKAEGRVVPRASVPPRPGGSLSAFMPEPPKAFDVPLHSLPWKQTTKASPHKWNQTPLLDGRSDKAFVDHIMSHLIKSPKQPCEVGSILHFLQTRKQAREIMLGS